MKEKELHKLKRQDLLELLLTQSKDVARQQEEIDTLKARNEELQGSLERLITKLDEKDVQIEHLKERLNHKDEELQSLSESRIPVGDGTKTADLSEIFAAAEAAVREYLKKKA